MGNRGNQDYFKIQGTRTEDRDLAGAAHRHLSEQTAVEKRQRKHAPTGPQATPVHLHTPPKYKEPEPRTEPAAPTVSSQPPEPGPPHEPTPLAFDIARALVEGAWRVAAWAASATLDVSRRAIERRMDRLWDTARRIEESRIGRALHLGGRDEREQGA